MPTLIVLFKEKDMKKIDIIWNITLICMWDCQVCCVDAVYAEVKSGKIKIKSENLNKEEEIPYDKNKGPTILIKSWSLESIKV